VVIQRDNRVYIPPSRSPVHMKAQSHHQKEILPLKSPQPTD
jgi:hypothetical protein